MALPWLIGAAVVYGAAKLLSSDNDDDDDDDYEERQREKRRHEREAEERAANERAERNRVEREQAKQRDRTAVKNALVQDGNSYAPMLSQALTDIVEVRYTSDSPYRAVINGSGIDTNFITQSFIKSYELGFLDNVTRANLERFETLYDVALSPSQVIYDAHNLFSDSDDLLNDLQSYRKRLQKLKDNL
ncbi:hypothetical protein [Plesiomonas shigelloides]|uniref:hypothetical protein n=1 Tax=Plesiomonas shigelloides TaxID=703 RepID=UPI001C5A5F3F|nr:hypothetical protein [Plesiomonas shigelloides]MBW3794273.1 hypothetical protein [Plesiomonas shigelloides]